MGNHTKQTQKTKAKIKKALMELVNEKDYELMISVKKLVFTERHSNHIMAPYMMC